MKIPAARFLIALVAGLLLLSGSVLHADTVITDPKGKTLCIGKSYAYVNLEYVNFDQKLKDLKACSFLIVGMIDGRIVGVDTKQEPTRPTYNKLFFITLLGDGKGSFSGLVEDVIPLKGAMTLKDFVKYDVMNLGGARFGRTRCQLLPWEGAKPDGTIIKYVFLIDEYQRDIAVFELKAAPVQGAGESMGLQELAYVRKLVLPSKGTKPYQNYFINALDVIDLNAFRDNTAPPNTNSYPKALMVWCKPNGCTGYENTQLDAPTDVLTCSLDDAVTTIKIESEDHFNFDPYSDSSGDALDNVVGGFLTAPDETGKLCYWLETMRGDNWSFSGNSTYYFDIHKKAISYTPPSAYSSRGFVKTEGSTRTCEWYVKKGWHMNQHWHDCYLSNPGPKVSYADDADKTVRIRPAVAEENKRYDGIVMEAGSDRIGVCDAAPQDEVDRINQNIRITGGAIPSDPAERLKRLARVEGWTVLRVFLGQPYIVAPKNTPVDPVKPKMIYKDCYISYKYDKASLYQYAFNNGTATSQSYGLSGKKTSWFAKFDVGVKGSYEYKYNKATNAEVTIGAETEQRASGAHSFDQGTIVYTSVKPYVSSMARIVPNKGAKNLTVNGDSSGRFALMMINAAPQQNIDSRIVTFQHFLCTNPAVTSEGADGTGKTYEDAADGDGKTLQFKTPYSVLSDGLVSRSVSSLIECTKAYDDATVDNARKLIRDWQDSNNVIADIKQFNSTEGGISAYFGKVENGQVTPLMDGAVNVGFNQSAAFSIVQETETKVTRSHQGSVGFYWNLDFLSLFNTKGEVNYKGGREELNTDSEKNKFEVGMGGWDGAPSYKRSYYYYWVDVPSIKSFMSSHAYTLQAGENKGSYTNEVHRPGFIPTYCWVNNQSFMLGVPWIRPGLNASRDK